MFITLEHYNNVNAIVFITHIFIDFDKLWYVYVLLITFTLCLKISTHLL